MTDRASGYTDVPVMTQEARAHNREAARGKGGVKSLGVWKTKGSPSLGHPEPKGDGRCIIFNIYLSVQFA